VSEVKRIMISLPNSLLVELDWIAAADQQDRSEFILRAMDFYIAECKRRLLREQMKTGYIEMAKINLALVIELYCLESEVTDIYELSVTEVK
jgi:CopG family transcriptional regulator / antitoxin EndoAI